MSVLETYRNKSEHRRRQAIRHHQRLDIQGLRMIAVLTVFANHLWGWPSGGFVGVDVFFVISGFLITGNLMRTAEIAGTVSFKAFYWNRVRRIVPAATVVLILTCIASLLVFMPFRSQQVGVDAFFAFIFLANWNFAIQDTDYFQEGNALSPIQHYWSLSIEEQFYFVWPALIFLVSAIVIRRSWNHARRMQLAGGVMAVIVVASFSWAIYQTAAAPAWAYFDTLTRVWELGFGALLATVVGFLGRIPDVLKPALSWSGLGLIAASLVLINDNSVGFPAPWALVPVTGAALVIAAGVNGEPNYQAFLRNPVSTYIGDISYSLYLVHWPIIVILAAVMDVGPYYYVVVVAATFGLSIASYHLVESPLRRADWRKFRLAIGEIRGRRYEINPATKYGAVASISLVTIALAALALQPNPHDQAGSRSTAQPAGLESSSSDFDLPEPPAAGPAAADLQNEIAVALQAAEWPTLDPSMESVIGDPRVNAELSQCGNPEFPDPSACSFGSPTATTRIVLVGDSIAMTYVGPLSDIALNSSGGVQLIVQSMDGCQFVDEQMSNDDPSKLAACPARKQHAVDVINSVKPTNVIIANQYGRKIVDGTNATMSEGQWATSMTEIIDKFRANTQQIVFLSPPPADAEISDCYGTRASKPADCISYVTPQWSDVAWAENKLAADIGGLWIDSRQWFCQDARCPSFVGSTPTKRDQKHMTNAYAKKITPAFYESLSNARVLPTMP